MKRVFAVVLAMLMVLSLAACGEDQPTNAPTQPQVTRPAPTEPAPTEPAPTEPAPTEPAPTEPAPTEPAPTEPAPTEPPHTHAYTEQKVAPTCTEAGYTVHTCACGDSYQDAEVAATGHSFADATCTAPKTCSACGATEGEAKGHDYTEATCTEPKTCKVCGNKDGKAAGHNYQNGVCAACGEADPELKQLDSGKWMAYTVGADGEMTWYQIVFADGKIHVTCDSAMLITTLSEQLQQDIRENEPARLIEFQGNTYVMPRGTNSFSAVYTVEGNRIKAETNEPEYMCIVLMRKGVDQLEVVEGSFNGVSAGIVLTWETNEHKHMFIGGSCTEPMKCVGCDATKGEPQGHDYADATCAAPKTCKTCGAQEGEPGSHQDVKGYCAICGKQVSRYANLEENSWEAIMVYGGNAYVHRLRFSQEFPSSVYTKEYTPNESDWDSTFGIEYEGVKYDSGYGESDNVTYILEGDRVICYFGYDPDFYGVVVLERISGTELKVVSVEIPASEEGERHIFKGVTVGTVFTNQA